MILLPEPKKICRLAGVCNNTKRIRFAEAADLQGDAYRLDIAPEGVAIAYGTPAARFYAEQTLKQIRAAHPDGPLPCLSIEDWCDFPARGFHHDVARGKVPTRKTLFALAEKCAHYKLNQLQLYVEHTFAFKKYPEVWRGASPLTADDIRALDAHCAKLHIDLVPSFSTFGHFYTWLSTPRFKHLNEIQCDASAEPFNWWDRMAHYTLDCRNPQSIRLVEEIIREVRPLFRSRYFNICADETFDLGKGRNRALAAKVGAGRLYVDFLKKIMAAIRAAGAVPMFWGDVIAHHPGLISEIDDEAIALAWDYSAKIEWGTGARDIAASGRKFYVCPGVCGWDRPIHNYQTAYENITAMAALGREKGASGLLNTDWGDCGHVNALGLSFPGLVLGACQSWNGATKITQLESEQAISRYELGDPSGTLLTLLRRIGSEMHDCWRALATNVQPPSRDFLRDGYDGKTGVLKWVLDIPWRPDALAKIRPLAAQAEKVLRKCQPRDPHVASEIRTGLVGAEVLEGLLAFFRTGRRAPRLAERLKLYSEHLEADWKARNKPSEWRRLKEVLEALGGRLTEINFAKEKKVGRSPSINSEGQRPSKKEKPSKP